MDIDEKTVQQVAKVARLNLTGPELKRFSSELQEILSAFAEIQKANTEGIEPSFHPIPLADALREDTVREGIDPKTATSLTQNRKDEYFKGPKVMG